MEGAGKSIDTGTGLLLGELRGGVATLTLNRPEARNALSDELTPALRRMILRLGHDPAVGALVLTGTGPAFCAGGDVKSMGRGRGPGAGPRPGPGLTRAETRVVEDLAALGLGPDDRGFDTTLAILAGAENLTTDETLALAAKVWNRAPHKGATAARIRYVYRPGSRENTRLQRLRAKLGRGADPDPDPEPDPGPGSGPKRSPGEAVLELQHRQRTLTGVLAALPVPTIAALPGPAAGAGLALALACDLRFAAASAFVTTGYARIGLSGDYGINWLLTRLVGTAKARELMFTADRVDAETCARIGLVNRVFPDGSLRSETAAFAARLAAGPREAIALMKRNLDRALTSDFPSALDQEAELLVRAAGTEEHREAVRAFLEKRPPRFRA